MNKRELLGCYVTAMNRIQIVYASLFLWAHPDTPQFFDALYDEIRVELKTNFPAVKDFLRDTVATKIACEQLYDMAHRAALNELFPLTKTYCRETNQVDKLKAQPWFPLWALLRNCFAHDMIFNFNRHERSILPVTWSGVTIDELMNGKPLTHGNCSRERCAN